LSRILAAASRFLCRRRFLLYNSCGANSSSGRDGFLPGRVDAFGLPSELTEFNELIDVTELTLFGSPKINGDMISPISLISHWQSPLTNREPFPEHERSKTSIGRISGKAFFSVFVSLKRPVIFAIIL